MRGSGRRRKHDAAEDVGSQLPLSFGLLECLLPVGGGELERSSKRSAGFSSAAIEPQHFQARRALVGEDEQCAAAHRIGADALARRLRKAIEAMTQIDRCGANDDPNAARNPAALQHREQSLESLRVDCAGICRRRALPSSSTNGDDATIVVA
jgi:hypothetical protein